MDLVALAKRAQKKDLSDVEALCDYFEVIRLLEKEPEQFDLAHRYNKEIRKLSGKYAVEQNSWRMLELNKRSLLFDAPHDLDAAFRYAEWNREQTKRFYLPRRKQLYPIVKAIERLAKREIRLLGVMAPPGVGKTTVALGGLVWMGMRNPELSILGASHSNSFLRGVYDEIGRMLDPAGEYLWHEIFPLVKVANTNAKDMRIDLGKRKRFETFEFSSVGSGNDGAARSAHSRAYPRIRTRARPCACCSCSCSCSRAHAPSAPRKPYPCPPGGPYPLSHYCDHCLADDGPGACPFCTCPF